MVVAVEDEDVCATGELNEVTLAGGVRVPIGALPAPLPGRTALSAAAVRLLSLLFGLMLLL